MVDIVISGIVVGQVLQWVPGESISTVIINGFDGGEREIPHALAVRHSRRQESDASTSGVKQESLDRMVVKGTERVGDVKSVVAGMEGD